MPVRFIAVKLTRVVELRYFVCYVLAAGSMLMAEHAAADVRYGTSTYQHAYLSASGTLPEYLDLRGLQDIAMFIGYSIPNIIETIRTSYCPACRVSFTASQALRSDMITHTRRRLRTQLAITASQSSPRYLSDIGDYVCTDFEPSYPTFQPRNCTEASASWEQFNQSLTMDNSEVDFPQYAPCCDNAALVTISLAVQAIGAIKSRDTYGFNYTALALQPDYRQILFQAWLRASIESNDNLCQLIIARGPRMIGVS